MNARHWCEWLADTIENEVLRLDVVNACEQALIFQLDGDDPEQVELILKLSEAYRILGDSVLAKTHADIALHRAYLLHDVRLIALASNTLNQLGHRDLNLNSFNRLSQTTL
jgi:hypothetical protein